jgi:Trp operon repressor
MSGNSHIDYQQALAGHLKKNRTFHPLGAYMSALGATVSSNEFVDRDLKLGEDHFENILAIIRSAKKQGHAGLTIQLSVDSAKAIYSRISEIAALECVDVETYDNKMAKVSFTFPERKWDWLLQLAKRELPAEEYNELSQLIASRLVRSEREYVLTKMAIGTKNTKGELS